MKRLITRLSSSAMIAVVLATLGSVASAQPRYRLKVISPPGAGPFALPADIDNRGQIAGFIGGPPNPFTNASAFLHTRRGRFVPLTPLPGALSTGVNAIGQNGHVVGNSGADLMTSARAAMWDGAGNVTDVGTLPGHTFALANDASFSGKVIGASGSVNFGDTVGFIWERGRMRQLSTPGFRYASPEAFNAFGGIAGTGWNTAPPVDGEGFILSRRGRLKKIGRLPGGNYSSLVDMNLFGTAVGFADDSAGMQNGIIYRWGKLRAIPPLPGDVASSLQGINNWGSAVGQSAQAMGPPRGVISRFGRPLVDLNTLLDPATRGNWFVFAAGGINDYGQIIAVAFDTTSPMPGGTHVLLTPIYR